MNSCGMLLPLVASIYVWGLHVTNLKLYKIKLVILDSGLTYIV
jgi:hypothetical protein